jgi:plasmid stabilization system protein ParE
MFEVVLRNAMDEQLCAWNAKQPNTNGGSFHSPDWLLDPAPLLIRLTRNGQDIRKARDHAAASARSWQPSRAVAHSDVLAQLSLGTWRYLLPNKDPGRQRLWNEALRDAFPQLATSPRSLTAKVHDIHLLRNRVAHLEPLIRTGVVRDRLTDVLHVLRAIDTMPEQWAAGQQRVTTVLKARPRCA